MQRIAKAIANSRIYSRRQAEQLIKQGCVTVNDNPISSPALLVKDTDTIKVNGKIITASSNPATELWLFNKPTGVLTTKSDPNGRTTIYNILPENASKLLYIGRLDYNSEGLLLLTNNGTLANNLTLAKNNIKKVYRVKTFGKITQKHLDSLFPSIKINGVIYKNVKAKIIKQSGLQTWIIFTLTEGKNNEIRYICNHFKLKVRKLIREQFWKFYLGNLPKGSIEKIPSHSIPKDYLF